MCFRLIRLKTLLMHEAGNRCIVSLKKFLVLSKLLIVQLFLLSKLPAFAGLAADIVAAPDSWHDYCAHVTPHVAMVPGRWDKHLTSFQKLLVLRCVRQDFLTQGIYNYVRDNMGQVTRSI